MKQFIKYILTIILHPLLSIVLFVHGNREGFIIGARASVKNSKYLHLGKKFRIGKDARFLMVDEYKGEKFEPYINIGDNVFMGNRCSILASESVCIGSNTLIASDVFISSENHGIDPNTVSYSDNSLKGKKVTIGEGCWIGEKVVILPGVNLGKKSIVGAGSIVTKSFPDYSMIVGNPAKLIKTYDLNKKEWTSVNSSGGGK